MVSTEGANLMPATFTQARLSALFSEGKRDSLPYSNEEPHVHDAWVILAYSFLFLTTSTPVDTDKVPKVNIYTLMRISTDIISFARRSDGMCEAQKPVAHNTHLARIRFTLPSQDRL